MKFSVPSPRNTIFVWIRESIQSRICICRYRLQERVYLCERERERVKESMRGTAAVQLYIYIYTLYCAIYILRVAVRLDLEGQHVAGNGQFEAVAVRRKSGALLVAQLIASDQHEPFASLQSAWIVSSCVDVLAILQVSACYICVMCH